jgi:hypothetical protein
MRRFALSIAMSIALAVAAWLVAGVGAHAHGAGHHHSGAPAMTAAAMDAGSPAAAPSAMAPATHEGLGALAASDTLDGHCDGAPAQHAGDGDCCFGFCQAIAHLQGSAPAGAWRARPPRCFEPSALLSPMPAVTPDRPPRFRAG